VILTRSSSPQKTTATSVAPAVAAPLASEDVAQVGFGAAKVAVDDVTIPDMDMDIDIDSSRDKNDVQQVMPSHLALPEK